MKKVEEGDGRYEIRLSGSGGQGLVLAGVILAEALGVYEGKNVTQTQSYGPEARGGTSRSDIVVSQGEIYYPKTTELDLLLCLTQESCDGYFGDLKEEGILIVDSDRVRQLPIQRAYSLPFINTARDKVGTPVVANVVSLAAVAAISGICSRESIEKAVLDRAPRGTEEKNKLASDLGFELGSEARRIRDERKVSFTD
ncbi:MAG: 2-oxoacid:acceptor oxidoreductase family protein [Candidatus Zixiibacteriota bacterium]|nr:MAG: 2-oxoacid:acceptor oxidoreductase family protein [candidate division Zixibacteria bacterium]